MKGLPAQAGAMLLGRILIVIGLIPNGLGKLANFELFAAAMGGTPQSIGGRLFPPTEPLVAFPFPELFLAGAITLDLLGAVLVIAGFKARAVAWALFWYCCAAIALYHEDLSAPGTLQTMLRTAPLLGGLLYIAARGAGTWSLDAWFTRNRPARP